MNGWPSRILVLLISAIGGFLLAKTVAGVVIGLLVGLAAIGLGIAAGRAGAATLTGAFAGLVIGLAAAQLMALALGTLVEATTKSYVLFFLSVILGYLGLVIGGRRGLAFAPPPPPTAQEAEEEKSDRYKILDTSVIIDGRIADICETGFLEGTFVIPQFVLRELQHIADSSDALKRNRGRRGLDVLHRLQKKVDLDIVIVETDFPRIREVDGKLIALAKQNGGKIITNDYNLNKVAELQGVTVLNINQLANALKPVVLPGETMKVYILKEGKEANQGVAYLDDGTMVVVDNAKREIGKTIEVLVTSVLQTTAGRMIFTQIKDESRNGS